MEEDRGQWMQTYSGHKFYPFNPRTEEVKIEDIAHALSLICRFGGHCKAFYSVAQHSILASEYLKMTLPAGETPEQKYESINEQLRGLLHDASEYVMGDMVRPIKVMLPEYSAAEDRLHDVIAEAYKLGKICNKTVKYADNVMLATEMASPMLFDFAVDNWTKGLPPAWDGIKITPLSPTVAEKAFINAFWRLMNERESASQQGA